MDDKWFGWFWGYSDEVFSVNFDCYSIQGQSSTLLPLILQEKHENLIFIDRAETILHDHFGDVHYWQSRRSMRYAKQLVTVGDQFRLDRLNSSDQSDRTELVADWSKIQKKHGQAKGGPYLAVHWRRKDFLNAHEKEVPTIDGTAEQIGGIMKKVDLELVFLATDAPETEIAKLRSSLPENVVLKRFVPSKDQLNQLKEGGISIIDQWICAHARHFIGSYVSTFSLRIHEDREILGFDPQSTFNRFCPDSHRDCEQPARWKIVY